MPSSRNLLVAVLGLGLLQACERAAEPAPAANADQIFTNGKILTVDEAFSIAEAMAIRGDRVLAVGTNEEILALADADTTATDLRGRTVVPGLIDNHMHFVRAGRDWYRHVRWDGVTSRRAALQALSDRAAQTPEGEWVLVIGGWNYAQFRDDDSLFSRAELDAAVPDRPLYIQEGYSRGFANTLALESAGLTADSAFSGRGALVTDGAGELSGELVGAAMSLVTSTIPAPSPDTAAASLQQAIHSMHGMGLTTVYDVGGNGVTPAYYDAVERAAEDGQLTMRVFYSFNGQHGVGDSANEIIAALRLRRPDNNGLSFAQFGWGESTYAPMRAQPWHISPADLESYAAISVAAAENGWQMHEHSMRDAKIQAMLDVFETVNATHPLAGLRWTIAHTNGISDASIARANALGLVFAVHSSSRLMLPERYAAGERSAPPIRAIRESGGIWGLGSDSTAVASPNPFHNIGWVVSGLSPAGQKIFDQTVPREAALTAHTRTNAYLLFREDHLGSLAPGKLADFAVLDRDYMTVPDDEIKDIRAILTVVGGKIVYEAL